METLQPDSRPWRTVSLLLMLMLGMGAFLVTWAAVCGLSMALLDQRRFLPNLTLPMFSLIAAGNVLGLALAWQALEGLRGKPSRPFVLSPAWAAWLCLAYGVSVVAGQTVVNLKLATALTLPVFHVIALSLPPLLILWTATALAKNEGLTWRQMVSGLGSGAFGATGLAFAVEAALAVTGVVAVVVMLGASSEGAERLRQFRLRLGNSMDAQFLITLLRNPAVVVALFFGLGVIVPLVEEPVKSLVPALAGINQPLTPARGFLLGVASGAGFAVLEGMLNGGLSIQGWNSVALLRIGSTAMHCLASGLTGWGWGQVWPRRGWLRLMAAYAAACALHGVWNSISIGMTVVAEVLEPGSLQTALVTLSGGLLVMLSIGALVALMVMAKKMGRPGGAA